MLLEVNRLIDSEFDMLQKIGWLLYNRDDQNGGLSLEEVYSLLHITTEEEMQKECQASYDEGFNDGVYP